MTAGAGVEVVLSGRYALRLAAPFRVRRGAAGGVTGEADVPADVEVTLGPGDAAVYPDYAVPAEGRSVGAEPLVVVGAAIVAAEPSGTPAPALPAGVTGEVLGHATRYEWRKLPAGPTTVTLWRLTLPPGAGLPPYEPPGLEAIHVEAGAVGVGAWRPGEPAPPRTPPTYIEDGTVPFAGLDPGTRRVVANAGDEPAVLLVLTVAPAGG